MQVHLAGLCFTDAHGAPFSHDVRLVVLSYVVAAAGSYAALEMAEGLRGAAGRAAWFWLAGSAATLGGSIWAMHFVGLLARRLPVPVSYDLGATLLSLLIAIASVALGLQIVRSGRLSATRLVGAGAVVGLGIAAMHFIGMQALRFTGDLDYRPGLFAVSILVAVMAAIGALWLALGSGGTLQRLLGALVMAVAICGMHFTGMAAAVPLIDPTTVPASGADPRPLAAAIAGTVVMLLVLAVVAASGSRRLFAATAHETEALRRANAELEATQREILRRLCRAGEFRDSATGEHVDRIGLMAHRLALAAGHDRAFAEAMLLAAPLHDIGKIGVPDAVLLKPGQLDPREWEDMRRHSEIGHTILVGTGMALLELSAEIARSHHEKWDGTGYPRGLAGDTIPISGRIVAIVDVFDALLSPRPYKQPWSVAEAVAHIRAQAGRHFDPILVEAFLADLPGIAGVHAAAPAPVPTLGPETPHPSEASGTVHRAFASGGLASL